MLFSFERIELEVMMEIRLLESAVLVRFVGRAVEGCWFRTPLAARRGIPPVPADKAEAVVELDVLPWKLGAFLVVSERK